MLICLKSSVVSYKFIIQDPWKKCFQFDKLGLVYQKKEQNWVSYSRFIDSFFACLQVYLCPIANFLLKKTDGEICFFLIKYERKMEFYNFRWGIFKCIWTLGLEKNQVQEVNNIRVLKIERI